MLKANIEQFLRCVDVGFHSTIYVTNGEKIYENKNERAIFR